MAHLFSGTLAGLALVLAFILGSGLLFVTAALLAAIAGVTQLFFWRKKNASVVPKYQFPVMRDELSDLGIIEIRPKAKIANTEAPEVPAAVPSKDRLATSNGTPATSSVEVVPSVDSGRADSATGRGGSAAALPPRASSGDGAMVAGPDEIPLTIRPVADQEYSVRWAHQALDSRVIIPCLEALAAATGSQTACLI